MIHVGQIEVRGLSDAGPFGGSMTLAQGLQVISARNAYGKSLAATAVVWCLGAEPLFGTQDGDLSCFPGAVRDELELPGPTTARVLSSECSVRVLHQDGRQLRLSPLRATTPWFMWRNTTTAVQYGKASFWREGRPCRTIMGDFSASCLTGCTGLVWRFRHDNGGAIRQSKLLARRQTMQDDHGGFQRFLFDWLHWPRLEVSFKGVKSEVYLENLLPTFYINQDEGWTELQALQIGRYGQQQISGIVIEYQLGALEAAGDRVARQQARQRELALRDRARTISDQVGTVFRKHGWSVDWSSSGTIENVVARWSSRTLREALNQEAAVDLPAHCALLNKRINQLRDSLTKQPLDPSDTSAPVATSQAVIELKEERHNLNGELHALRIQGEQTEELVESFNHRIQAASDLLRLKRTGIGRLDRMECPSCHRDIDPETFGLTDQTEESVSAHIDALKRDKQLMGKNYRSLQSSLEATQARLQEVDSLLRNAERSLVAVTAAVGTQREQLAKRAADLAGTERELDRAIETVEEIEKLQNAIDKWISDTVQLQKMSAEKPDLEWRRSEFDRTLRSYVTALGHSAVNAENSTTLFLDDQYVPHLSSRRLRSLGSASDQSRLVAAYSLALAATSQKVDGLHPGVVILDEPLQQNPDQQHRELFISFLSQQLAREARFQTLIFTWLNDVEVKILRDQGTEVLTPEGNHLLKLLTTSEDHDTDSTH